MFNIIILAFHLFGLKPFNGRQSKELKEKAKQRQLQKNAKNIDTHGSKYMTSRVPSQLLTQVGAKLCENPKALESYQPTKTEG